MPDTDPGKGTRRVVGSISLSLDGRTTGPGGEYDMGWIAPYAVTDVARDRLMSLTAGTTTVLLGRKNYQGFSGYWQIVADDDDADVRDRKFSRWLDNVEKIVFTRTLDIVDWRTRGSLSRIRLPRCGDFARRMASTSWYLPVPASSARWPRQPSSTALA
jgi:hypothetical protein